MRNSKISKTPSKRGNSKQRDESFSNPLIRKTWLSLAILDLIFYYSIYIRLKEWFGTKIICDRYIFDTKIDFKLNFPQETIEEWFIWKLLIRLALKPKKHFVLTISVEESQRRSKLKDEPFPDSIETLKFRLNDYLNYSKKNKFVMPINCDQSIESIHQIIINSLK